MMLRPSVAFVINHQTHFSWFSFQHLIYLLNRQQNMKNPKFQPSRQKPILLKQGHPPQESERGPYAVVDERCEDTTLDPSMKDLLQRQVLLISWTLVDLL